MSMSAQTPPIFRLYLGALLAGDRRAAVRVVESACTDGLSAADLLLGVVQPAQRSIGCLWEEGRISVAEEHLATGISQLVLARLYADLPREPANGKRAVVACVEGEQHDMGARMGADFLEMSGFDVRLLGANVPLTSLARMVHEVRPDLVGLSASMSLHVPALERAVTRLRKLQGPPIPIVLGGNILTVEPGLAARLGIEVFGTDARALMTSVRSHLRC